MKIENKRHPMKIRASNLKYWKVFSERAQKSLEAERMAGKIGNREELGRVPLK